MAFVARTRRGVGIFGLTVMLLGIGPSPAGAEDQPWQPIVDAIASGSGVAASGSTDPGNAESGSAGPVGMSVSTGSADVVALRLGPDKAARGALDTVESPAAETEPAGEVAVPGVDTGSALAACAGSAALGSTGLLLGLATASGFGSGLIGPGSNAGSGGIAAVVILSGSGMGSVVVSSGSGLGSAMVGSAAGGSAAAGSAAMGSAVLTCLLAAPTPPLPPFSPLQLAPPPVLLAPPAPVAAPVPPLPVPVRRPVAASPSAPVEVAPADAPATWGVLELVILLVVSIITIQTTTLLRSQPTTFLRGPR